MQNTNHFLWEFATSTAGKNKSMSVRAKKQIKLDGIEPKRLLEKILSSSLGQVFIWRSKGSSVIRIGIDFHPGDDAYLEDEFEYYSLRDFEDSAKPSRVYIPKVIINFIESNAHIIAQDSDPELYKKVLVTVEELNKETAYKDKQVQEIEVTSNDNPTDDLKEWHNTFDGAMNLIKNGTVEKIVISRTKQFNHSQRDLNQFIHWAPLSNNIENKAQYFVLLKRENGSIHYSMTPETLFAKEGANIFIDALAGTRKVSPINEENEHIAKELLQNKKENHEHRLVEKYIESVLNSINITWSQNISKHVKVLKYVQHLHSQYRAKVNIEQWEELKNSFHPTPAVGARPYQYWTKILDLEPRRRGLYAGLIGWHGLTREDICVNLRCLDITHDKLMIHAGCGIVEQSEAKHEYIETERKMFNFTQYLKMSSKEADIWPNKNL